MTSLQTPVLRKRLAPLEEPPSPNSGLYWICLKLRKFELKLLVFHENYAHITALRLPTYAPKVIARSIPRQFQYACSDVTVAVTLSGKSTHISMISNSVIHLQSYINTTITDIAKNSEPISPVTPRDDVSASSTDIVASNDSVSQCFKGVSWCFTSGSWSFTSGSWCFTMHHYVLHVFHDVLPCLTMFYDV